MTTVRLQHDMYVLCVQIFVQYLGGPELFNDYMFQLKTSFASGVYVYLELNEILAHNKRK